jgi:hypothetical protein
MRCRQGLQTVCPQCGSSNGVCSVLWKLQRQTGHVAIDCVADGRQGALSPLNPGSDDAESTDEDEDSEEVFRWKLFSADECTEEYDAEPLGG